MSEVNSVEIQVTKIVEKHIPIYEQRFIEPILADLRKLEEDVLTEFASNACDRDDPRRRDIFAQNIMRIHQTRIFLMDRCSAVRRNPHNYF